MVIIKFRGDEMYLFYLDNILLPITPSKLSTKIGGNNKTMELANSGEINLIKFPKLTEYSFDFELVHNINYIKYRASGNEPKVVLDFLENAKSKKKVITFRVIRKQGKTTRFPLEAKVTVENYDIDEDADNNSDITVSLTLKQFRPYRTSHLLNQTDQYPRPVGEEKSGPTTVKKEEPVRTSAVLKKVEIKTHLNIRSGAGTHNRRIAKFSPGDKPCIYGVYNYKGQDWYKVKHSRGDNGWGWISGNGKYVKVIANYGK